MKFSFLRKVAVTGLLAGALFVAGPGLASASVDDAKPSDGFSVVDQQAMPKVLDRSVSSDASTQAVFDCLYVQYPSEIYFDCIIYSGALQFLLNCSDGNTYLSPWYAGPARWLVVGSCGPGVLITSWGVIPQ